MNEYIHNIQKTSETNVDRIVCTYSYQIGDNTHTIQLEGMACNIIDALGNALVKESFQKFEK